jgi:hypothetical protein
MTGRKQLSEREKRVPTPGSIVELRSGYMGEVACSWYAEGEGGFRIVISGLGTFGLRDIKRVAWLNKRWPHEFECNPRT